MRNGYPDDDPITIGEISWAALSCGCLLLALAILLFVFIGFGRVLDFLIEDVIGAEVYAASLLPAWFFFLFAGGVFYVYVKVSAWRESRRGEEPPPDDDD